MLRWNLLIVIDRHLGWLGIISIPIFMISIYLACQAAAAEAEKTALHGQQTMQPTKMVAIDPWPSRLLIKLSNTGDSALMQSELIRVASEHDIEIVHAEYRNAIGNLSGINKIQASLSLRGSYPAIRSCLREWLRMPGLAMERLQIEKEEEGLQTKIELAWFYQRTSQ